MDFEERLNEFLRNSNLKRPDIAKNRIRSGIKTLQKNNITGTPTEDDLKLITDNSIRSATRSFFGLPSTRAKRQEDMQEEIPQQKETQEEIQIQEQTQAPKRRVNFQLNKSDFMRLSLYAEYHNLSFSDIFESLIHDFLISRKDEINNILSSM